MSGYVLDASVAVKLYVPEVHSDLAARFFADGHELIAPDLLPSEFGNILWKKSTQRGEITVSEGQRIITEFQSLPIDYYSSLDLLEEAFKIATSTKRTIYDSVYIALASEFGCKKITDDRKLVKSLKDTSFAPLLSLLEDY
ncbi:MAG: PIN domain nuclease [Acidobacteria bacterium]|nr:MAG: PIN domain nuclease [Acidobacteriota bacterium]